MSDESSNQGKHQRPQNRRPCIAIVAAATSGIPAGIFLSMSAATPFGPILLGWGIAIGGAVFVTSILGLVAGRRHIAIGFAYAASLGLASSIFGIASSDQEFEWWAPVASFGITFAVVGIASLFGSVAFALGAKRC